MAREIRTAGSYRVQSIDGWTGPPRFVEYDRINALETDDAGALRLYRRRGLFGLLRRQDVFHPRGEWLTVKLHPSGKCQVILR